MGLLRHHDDEPVRRFEMREQLLAIGDRAYPVREKRLELQHPNVAFFNVTFKHLPQKEN